MNLEMNMTAKTLMVENVEAEQVNKIIDGFFQALGRAPKMVTVETTVSKVENTEKTGNAPKKVTLAPKMAVFIPESVENITEIAENITKKVENPPKVLPKVNDERTLHVSIGELFDQAQEKRNVRELPDGTKIYKAHYWCGCGNEGNRFILPTNNYLKCHECATKLLVEPATFEVDDNNLPIEDKYGNYFVARHDYEQ